MPTPVEQAWNILAQSIPGLAMPSVTPTTASRFGRRGDGSPKGSGFLGPLQRSDGGVSTELSMGTTDVDGHETQIPLLVPTLSHDEVQYLLTHQADSPDWSHPTMRAIQAKAILFAKQRRAAGQPMFAGAGEQQPTYPDFTRSTGAPE